MIYHSNLTAPDLSGNFKLLVKPRPWSLGHDIPSDPDYEPENCFFSHDEAAILYHCAKAIYNTPNAGWVDIGCRFGWTTAHIAESYCGVYAIDQVLKLQVAQTRFEHNMRNYWHTILNISHESATESLARMGELKHDKYAGFCIDGNHDSPEPLNDACGCLKISAPDCCMVFHDFRGRPIRDAVRLLMAEGFKSRVYWTPAMMAVCWRGSFSPPVHNRDPKVDWGKVREASEIDQDFDLRLCE